MKSVSFHFGARPAPTRSSTDLGLVAPSNRRDSVASNGSEDANLLGQPAHPHGEERTCGGGRRRVQKLCTHGARVMGATLTGALAGGALGCASFNPFVVGISAGVGALAGFSAHLTNDPSGDRDSFRNQLSQGIRGTMGGALTVAEMGVLSAPFGARFATIEELNERARELNLDETQTALLVGLASTAATVGWTIAIGGTVGVLALACRVLKEIINLPGHMAGSPLRIPADPLTHVASGIVFVFATGNVQAIRNTAVVAAGGGAAELGVSPFRGSLAPHAFEMSAATQSALTAATAGMTAICLYLRDGGAWKDMPLMTPGEFYKLIPAQLLEKMQGGVHMATTSPLTSIFRIELPDSGLAKVLGEMLKLGTTPAAFFGYYAVLVEQLSNHPVGEEASSTATPAFAIGGILFSLYWTTALVNWVTARTPEAIDEVNASDRTIYNDVQRALIMGIGVLTIAMVSDEGIDEAIADRGPGEGAAVPLAIMIGFASQLAARLGSRHLTTRQAQEGYGVAIAGMATGGLNGGAPAALAVMGGTLVEQAAGILYDWCCAKQAMERTTQAVVRAQADKREAVEAAARERADSQIEAAAQRRTAQMLAALLGKPEAAVQLALESISGPGHDDESLRHAFRRVMSEPISFSPASSPSSRSSSSSASSSSSSSSSSGSPYVAVFHTPQRRVKSPRVQDLN
jgi:hypothetical protein